MSGWLDRAKHWARSIKRDVIAVWLIARDSRTPWGVRLLAGCVALYALSPIDLIPDFIPVLGYLDDLLIVPLGILAVVRLVSVALLTEHRAAAQLVAAKPVSKLGLLMVVLIWLLIALGLAAMLTDLL